MTTQATQIQRWWRCALHLQDVKATIADFVRSRAARRAAMAKILRESMTPEAFRRMLLPRSFVVFFEEMCARHRTVVETHFSDTIDPTIAQFLNMIMTTTSGPQFNKQCAEVRWLIHDDTWRLKDLEDAVEEVAVAQSCVRQGGWWYTPDVVYTDGGCYEKPYTSYGYQMDDETLQFYRALKLLTIIVSVYSPKTHSYFQKLQNWKRGKAKSKPKPDNRTDDLEEFVMACRERALDAWDACAAKLPDRERRIAAATPDWDADMVERVVNMVDCDTIGGCIARAGVLDPDALLDLLPPGPVATAIRIRQAACATAGFSKLVGVTVRLLRLKNDDVKAFADGLHGVVRRGLWAFRVRDLNCLYQAAEGVLKDVRASRAELLTSLRYATRTLEVTGIY